MTQSIERFAHTARAGLLLGLTALALSACASEQRVASGGCTPQVEYAARYSHTDCASFLASFDSGSANRTTAGR